MSHNSYCDYSASKYFDQLKSRSFANIVDGTFGNVNLAKSDKNLAVSIMEAFKKSLSLNDALPDIKVVFIVVTCCILRDFILCC